MCKGTTFFWYCQKKLSTFCLVKCG